MADLRVDYDTHVVRCAPLAWSDQADVANDPILPLLAGE